MSKGLIALISVAAIFVCVLLGVFIGRNLTPSYISLSNTVSADTQVPAETADPYHDGMININAADAQMLAMLPGIGEVLAQRIVDYRTQNGDFISVEDLKNVEGIGDGKLEAILEYVTTGGDT